jgi:predicted glycosyltransferase
LPAELANPRVLIHVQHLLGTGHLRRAVLVAQALAGNGFQVTLASGGAPLTQLDLRRVELVQLPSLTAGNSSFDKLLTDSAEPPGDRWKARRRDVLLSLYQRLRPDLVVVEAFPFGRRALRFELLPLLQRIAESRPRPLLVASIRDVLHAGRAPQRIEETTTLVRRHFDRVLIHGDPTLIRLEESFPAYARIADRCHYTGMVAPPAPTTVRGASEVLVSVGGGATGLRLLQAALAARPLSPLPCATWRLLCGNNLAEKHYQALRRAAADGVRVERSRDDFRERLAGCAASISQAGYNTVTDLLATRARAVVVPFEAGGETEQRQRAQRLAERGLMQIVNEGALCGEVLAAAMVRALRLPPPSHSLDLRGATRSAELLRDWLAAPREALP